MIVGMIPTYKEGKLARDAITSLINVCNCILVFEGRIKGAPDSGIDTDFGKFRGALGQKCIRKVGEWESEVAKRNAMLEYTRRFKPPVWGIFLDADEVILWPEYIESYIEACDAQAPEDQMNVACPLLRVEVDGSIQTLKRIVRLDMLERHMLSMSQWKFYGSDIAVTFPAIPSERTPNMGEPHIFHRAFLRPPVRGGFRLYEREIEDFQLLEKVQRDQLGLTEIPGGAIPVQKDGAFIPIEGGKENVSPSTLLMEIQAAEEATRKAEKK